MTIREWYESIPEDCRDKHFYLLVSLDSNKFDWSLGDNDPKLVHLNFLSRAFIISNNNMYFPVFVELGRKSIFDYE